MASEKDLEELQKGQDRHQQDGYSNREVQDVDLRHTVRSLLGKLEEEKRLREGEKRLYEEERKSLVKEIQKLRFQLEKQKKLAKPMHQESHVYEGRPSMPVVHSERS